MANLSWRVELTGTGVIPVSFWCPLWLEGPAVSCPYAIQEHAYVLFQGVLWPLEQPEVSY